MPQPRSWATAANFFSAWMAVQLETDPWYKDQFRLAYRSFEWSLASNIEHLAKVCRVAVNPAPPVRLYRAKPNGLTRTTTLLTVPDQLIYHALARRLAPSIYRRVHHNYKKIVFSHNLLLPGRSNLGFFRDWRSSYAAFLEAQREAFSSGRTYAATLDLASFYDVISHYQLIELLRRYYRVDDAILSDLDRCLLRWTDYDEIHQRAHGIPQSLAPSHLLAEAYLHPLDEMARSSLDDVVYLRYGDDIRMFSSTEQPLRRAILKLDIFIKRLGLVPQVAKIKIEHVNDIESWIASDSISEPSSDSNSRVPRIEHDALKTRFGQCFRRSRFLNTPGAVRAARFALFRMNADFSVARRACALLAQFPEVMSDAANAYLRKTLGSWSVGQAGFLQAKLANILAHDHGYDWELSQVSETLWAFHRAYGLITLRKARRLMSPYMDETRQPILRIAALRWFMRQARFMQAAEARASDVATDWYTRLGTAAMLVDRRGSSAMTGQIATWLQDPTQQMQLFAAFVTTRDGLPRTNLRHVGSWAGPTFRHHGWTRRAFHPRIVEEVLERRFSVKTPAAFSFRTLLGVRYYRACAQHLLQADGSYYRNPSRFISQINNFNQLLLARLLPRLGVSVQVEEVFSRVGSPSKNLRRQAPGICVAFAACNRLRRNNPEPHPFATDYHDVSKQVSRQDRNSVVKQLKAAYEEVIRIA